MASLQTDTATLNRSSKLNGKPGSYEGKPVFENYSKAPMDIRWLHTSQLFIDRDVLVNPRMPWDRLPKLRKIAKEFDWDNFNPIKVAERSDGTFAVLNGGGSWWIITELLPQHKDLLIPCHVVKRRAVARQAEVFTSQRNTVPLRPRDFFEADWVAKKPYAVEIRDITARIGMVVPAPWPKGYQFIPVLKTIHAESDLEWCLLRARAAWGGKPKTKTEKKKPSEKLPPAVMMALGMIRKAYPGTKIAQERLDHVLASTTPRALVATVKSRGHSTPKQLAGLIAHELVSLYDADYRGALIGGERIGPKSAKRYQINSRPRLSDAIADMTRAWLAAK